MGDTREYFRQALRAVIEAYGADILNDSRRTNAILMDYAPEQVRERKLVISALNEGIGKNLLKVRDKDEGEIRQCIGRSIRCLIDMIWVTEEAAQFAVSTIAFALNLEAAEIPQRKPDTSTSVGRALEELPKGISIPAGTDIAALLEKYQVIGYKAFATNQTINELSIPRTIKTIKPKAFFGCTQLKRITIPPTVEEIGVGVFFGCDSLETISMDRNPNYTVVGGMLIDKKNKALMRVTGSVARKCVIPSDVTVIHPQAFERSQVNTVVLPGKLSELSGKSFDFCGNLESFEIDRQNEHYKTVGGVLHSKDGKRLIRFPSGYKGVNYILEDTVIHIEEGAFCDTANLESITFTSNLKTIGARAFEYSRNLSSLVLPSSVEIIGERAFQYCEHLASIMLPRSIQEIEDFAFCGCSEIRTISIPKAVKRIGNAAFKDCASLKRIIVQDDISYIGAGAFAGCAEDLEIVIKNNSYVQQYCSVRRINWSAL